MILLLRDASFFGIGMWQYDFNKLIDLDDTQVNARHSINKVWTDDTLRSESRKLQSGRGGRVIVSPTDRANCFVPYVLHIFRPRKIGDYHEDMKVVVFQSWFMKLMENIPPNRTIVMDNAPYYSIVKEKPPTAARKKAEIQNWLSKNSVEWSPLIMKPKITDLVQQYKPCKVPHEIDNLAHENGQTVLRIRLYHCQINPIELIWALVKEKVAKENTSFNLTEVGQLTTAACYSSTQSLKRPG